jgi:hypothetical protein
MKPILLHQDNGQYYQEPHLHLCPIQLVPVLGGGGGILWPLPNLKAIPALTVVRFHVSIVRGV